MAREARKRRGIKRIVFVCLLLVVGLVVWTKVSPWPSVLAIRAVFDIGGAKIARKLEKHVPTSGLNELRDVNYDSHDPAAKLDLFVPAGKPPRTTIVWIHGGGFVAGRKSEVANYARILASKGYGVASIEYTRAPNAHYPVPVEQANRALASELQALTQNLEESSGEVLAMKGRKVRLAWRPEQESAIVEQGG